MSASNGLMMCTIAEISKQVEFLQTVFPWEIRQQLSQVVDVSQVCYRIYVCAQLCMCIVIYFRSPGSKIRVAQSYVILTGSGLNVCNQYPTLSLTDCIQLHNKSHGTQLTCPSMELLLADILYFLEMLINDANARFAVGDSLFCKLYYQYWLHK